MIHQLRKYQGGVDSVIIITDKLQISLLQRQIDSSGILAIFLWKQTIQIMMNKNSRCNLLQYSPFIIWNPDQQHIQNEDIDIEDCDIERNVEIEMVQRDAKKPDHSLSANATLELSKQDSYRL